MKIIGTGSALPKNSIRNVDLEAIMETSDEWIRTRTGIEARYVATSEDETTSELAALAAQRAMESASISAEEIDLIIGATVSATNLLPTLACDVQARLGAAKAIAFDVSAACSGFMFAMAIADAYMKTGRCHKALLIGAENLTKIMDWNDRSTCVLFGDGAGAAIVSDEEDRVLGLVQGSDGASGMALCCKGRTLDNPFVENRQQLMTDYVHMDGQAVYRFAVKTVPAAITQALAQSNLTADEIDYFLLHQANVRILESVAKRLGQPIEKFPMNLHKCGNTSAASIPILLDEVVREGRIKPGDKIVLAGFGAGLTWGACVLEW